MVIKENSTYWFCLDVLNAVYFVESYNTNTLTFDKE